MFNLSEAIAHRFDEEYTRVRVGDLREFLVAYQEARVALYTWEWTHGLHDEPPQPRAFAPAAWAEVWRRLDDAR